MMRATLYSICTENYKENINKLVHSFSLFNNITFYVTQYQKRTGSKADGKIRHLFTDWQTRNTYIVSRKDWKILLHHLHASILLKSRDTQNRNLGNARNHKRQNEMTSEQSTRVRL
jgi:hypothetical protein